MTLSLVYYVQFSSAVLTAALASMNILQKGKVEKEKVKTLCFKPYLWSHHLAEETFLKERLVNAVERIIFSSWHLSMNKTLC